MHKCLLKNQYDFLRRHDPYQVKRVEALLLPLSLSFTDSPVFIILSLQMLSAL